MIENRKFYEDRIKHLEMMLETAITLNKQLMDNVLSRPTQQYAPYVAPKFENACAVCGQKGVNGYVCPNTSCPSRITSDASSSY